MEERPDEETTFSISFPAKQDYTTTQPGEIQERESAYCGETIGVILIARHATDDAGDAELTAWRERVFSLCIHASAAAAHSQGTSAAATPPSCSKQAETVATEQQKDFKPCEPISTVHGCVDCKEKDCDRKREPPVCVNATTVIFPLHVKLENIEGATSSSSSSCGRCAVHVYVWSPVKEKPEQLASGYLDAFVKFNPEECRENTCKIIKQTVAASLPVILPPRVEGRHFLAGHKHFVVVKVTNDYSSPLVVDKAEVLLDFPAAHKAEGGATDNMTDILEEESEAEKVDGSIKMAQFRQCGSLPPFPLQPLEEQCLLFELTFKRELDLSKILGKETGISGFITWQFPDRDPAVKTTQYRLPSIRVDVCNLVISASCHSSTVTRGQSFNVTYTIINNLQDFISMKLIWNPLKSLAETADKPDSYKTSVESVINSVVCHQPITVLGSCKVGSTVSAVVGFQIINKGVFEIGQHMRLHLQYAVGSLKRIKKQGISTSTRSLNMSTSLTADGEARIDPATFAERSHSLLELPQIGSPIHSRNMYRGSSSKSLGTSTASLGKMEQQGVITPDQVLKHSLQVYVL